MAEHSHPHMVLDVPTCERLTSVPQKVTAILATAQAPMNVLLWSVLSLLTRWDSELLHGLMVVINGPTEIEGELQDRKQRFMEDLRRVQVQRKSAPVTLIRVWGHVGHAHALEMALPWVSSEHYLIMHDDVILKRKDLSVQLSGYFEDRHIAIAHAPPLIVGGIGHWEYQGRWKLGFPHLNSTFLVCRKEAVARVGARWWGYHVPREFSLREMVNVEDFTRYHAARDHIKKDPNTTEPYGYLSTDIGAWIYYELQKRGYRFQSLSEDTICHLVAMSWGKPESLPQRIDRYQAEINDLEAELAEHPELNQVYRRWKE